ncbi:NAD(P)H-dependent flavin oxidoreductase [Bacillus tuaregi]|uniref:NAD(P)H-dependent flavin oxidoreductase n=1 Tax=Bacillus tuaregi TaxID=1816695 RepID=UPI0008F94A37|nr:nitronate monooxygenase [Bacillus tuaregi]
MITLDTPLCDGLNIKYPIIQAGMAGGSTTVELIANVCNAGGLGSLGAAYMMPDDIRKAIRNIKQQTDRPFAVNLFCVEDIINQNDKEHEHEVKEVLLSLGENLGITEDHIQFQTPNLFNERFQVLIEEEVPIISTAFGILPVDKMAAAKQRNIKVISMVTTVKEAMIAEKAGVDVIVAQGSDAGGHRSTFDIKEDPMGANIGTFSLIPQVVENVHIPVVAAGGVMNGKGLVAALALGAQGVQLGTKFLGSKESGIHPLYKKALFESTEEQTVLTKNFSGRPARGIKNKFIEEFDRSGVHPLAYPLQNTATSSLRKEAFKQNQIEYMALWAGQGLRFMQHENHAEMIIKELIDEAEEILG